MNYVAQTLLRKRIKENYVLLHGSLKRLWKLPNLNMLTKKPEEQTDQSSLIFHMDCFSLILIPESTLQSLGKYFYNTNTQVSPSKIKLIWDETKVSFSKKHPKILMIKQSIYSKGNYRGQEGTNASNNDVVKCQDKTQSKVQSAIHIL